MHRFQLPARNTLPTHLLQHVQARVLRPVPVPLLWDREYHFPLVLAMPDLHPENSTMENPLNTMEKTQVYL